jgi:hypothetical protein
VGRTGTKCPLNTGRLVLLGSLSDRPLCFLDFSKFSGVSGLSCFTQELTKRVCTLSRKLRAVAVTAVALVDVDSVDCAMLSLLKLKLRLLLEEDEAGVQAKLGRTSAIQVAAAAVVKRRWVRDEFVAANRHKNRILISILYPSRLIAGMPIAFYRLSLSFAFSYSAR